MKIVETVERECCTFKDLKVVQGSPKIGRDSEFKFCIHCGARHRQESVMDPAGSRDYEYQKMLEPWETR